MSVSLSNPFSQFAYGTPSAAGARSTPIARSAPSREQRPTTTTTARGPSYATPSRPPTALAQCDDDDGSDWVVSVLESRGIGREVGIAALDRNSGRCVLTQLQDVQSYYRTQHSLSQRRPALVLVPQSALTSKSNVNAVTGEPTPLVRAIQTSFEDSPVIGVARKFWDEELGFKFVSQLIVDNETKNSTLLTVEKKYIARSAAGALFSYLESELHLSYPTGTLRIRYAALEGTMLIDVDTAVNLELTANLLNRKSKQCLLGLFPCQTPMATRALKANLLSPLRDVETINARLDVVTELVRNEDRLISIQRALGHLHKVDYDKLIATLITASIRTSRDVSEPAKQAERKITHLLQLRALVTSLPSLASAVSLPRSALLKAMHGYLTDERPSLLRERIDEVVNAEAASTKATGSFAKQSARAYAIKSDVKLLLDVARRTYEENVGDAEALAQSYSTESGIEITLKWLAHGFVFSLAKDDDGPDLLRGKLLSRAPKVKNVQYSSLDLAKINSRIKSSLDEIFALSNDFAKTAVSQGYSRPEFGETLAIKDGRHPIIERFRSASKPFTPNEAYLTEAMSFALVTGCNMSGKTVYLQQTALIVVLAQVGSFVPADYACVPPLDMLLSRLSNDDSIADRLSTFAREMRTMSLILSALDPEKKVLVLVDELGRGTSPEEGVGIAHALAEEIIDSKALCLFTTHFTELTETLPRIYPSVTTLQLQTNVDMDSRGSKLRYTHQVVDGANSLKHYGLELAMQASLPAQLIDRAREIAAVRDSIEDEHRDESPGSRLVALRRYLANLKVHLQQVHGSERLGDNELRRLLFDLQIEAIRAVATTLDVVPASSTRSTV